MNGRMRAVLALFCCCALAMLFSCAPEEPSLNTGLDRDRIISEIEDAIPRLIEQASIPGLSIALIRDGETVWSGAYGVRSALTGEPVTEATVFEAASLTKPLFAYLVMKMVEKGEIDLDIPLFDYVPADYLEEEYIGHSTEREGFKAGWFRTITARMVLSHSSGLPHGEHRDPLPIHFEPGTEYRYSADGYYYLQTVVEYLRGKRLEEIMRIEVLEPLGMDNSSLVWEERFETMAAAGHGIDGYTDGEFRKRMRAYASASLYTTAVDYARFVNAVINGSGLDGATIDTMLSPQIEVQDGISWSLGFGLDMAAAGTGFWQWGDYGIFRSYVIAYRDERIGVVYLTNSLNGLSIRDEIVALAVGGGEHPVFSYPDYEQYYAPSFRIVQTALREGADAAVELLEDLIAEEPEEVTYGVLMKSGNTLRYVNRFKQAVALLEISAEIYPDSSDSHLYLGEAYFEDARYEEALESFRRKLDMDAGHEGAKLWYRQAELMYNITTRCMNSGLEQIEEIRREHPDVNWEARINAHGYDLLFAGRVLEAISVFKFNVAAFPDAWNTYDSLAEAYMENGDRELAVYYYMESLKRNPDNTNASEMIKRLK